MLTSVIGTVAALLTIAGFLPQAWRIIKTRDTRSLSTLMWVCSTTSFALWTVYGASLQKFPIIVPNAICCVLAGFILMMKLLPRAKRDRVADKVTEIVSPNA